MDKSEILKIAKDHQLELIRGIEGEINDLRSSADLDEEDTRDLEDFSHQDEWMETAGKMEVGLQAARQVLSQLEAISDHPADSGRLGAVILMNDTYHVLGAAFPPILHAERKIMGVSKEAPIYEALQGKKAGETVEVGGKEVTVEQVI